MSAECTKPAERVLTKFKAMTNQDLDNIQEEIRILLLKMNDTQRHIIEKLDKVDDQLSVGLLNALDSVTRSRHELRQQIANFIFSYKSLNEQKFLK